MSVTRLIWREILYRKLNFLLGVLSVLAAVGWLVAERVLVQEHNRRTEEIAAAMDAQTDARVRKLVEDTQKQMRKMEDEFRQKTVDMGFNLLILPRDQNLGDLFADDYASKYMPEEYAERLAKARVATINHLLPSLQQKVVWPEQKRTIQLMGVRGEVLIHGPKQKPILDAVPAGTVVVGYELHQSLKLAPGGKLTLLGREFKVHKLNPQRGNKDDITLWINLRAAQELLDKKGLINAMLALECHCAADRLSVIRAEIASHLPDTQVVEFATQAVMRAETRNLAALKAQQTLHRAQQEAVAARDQLVQNRARVVQEREAHAAVLIPVALFASALWIALLTWSNVRDRRHEIGILRAVGVRSGQVLQLFLAKAALMGLLGAALGYWAGLLVGLLGPEAGPQSALIQVNWPLYLLVLLAAPAVAALAALVPSLVATQQEPALVLRES